MYSVSESSTRRITYHLSSYYLKKILVKLYGIREPHWMGKKLSTRELIDFPRNTWHLRGRAGTKKPFWLILVFLLPSLYQCVTRERIIVTKFSLSKNIWLCLPDLFYCMIFRLIMKTKFLIIRFAFLHSVMKAHTKAVFPFIEIRVWIHDRERMGWQIKGLSN